MLLLALNDNNEAVYLSKLDRWEKPGVSCATNVRKSPISALVPLVNFLTFLRGGGYVPALLVCDARTRQMRACCRYQPLVLYLLVARG
jgi:hypothetical protein